MLVIQGNMLVRYGQIIGAKVDGSILRLFLGGEAHNIVMDLREDIVFKHQEIDDLDYTEEGQFFSWVMEKMGEVKRGG